MKNDVFIFNGLELAWSRGERTIDMRLETYFNHTFFIRAHTSLELEGGWP